MIRCPALASRPVVSTSRTICRMARESTSSGLGHGIDGAVGELVDALVTRDSRMSLDPVPLELVFLRERVELLPQVLVLDGLLVGGFPAAALPVRQPFEHA